MPVRLDKANGFELILGYYMSSRRFWTCFGENRVQFLFSSFHWVATSIKLWVVHYLSEFPTLIIGLYLCFTMPHITHLEGRYTLKEIFRIVPQLRARKSHL
jgi:hypothetical protein